MWVLVQRQEPLGMRQAVVSGVEPPVARGRGPLDQEAGRAEVHGRDRQRAQRREDDQLDVVAVGGDLEPQTLIAAYRAGVFPWPT